MIFDRPRSDGEGVAGPATSMGEVFDAAVRSAWYVDNPLARRAALEEAYDKRIEAVFTATGQRLANPARLARPPLLEHGDDWDVERDASFSRLARQGPLGRSDPYAAFDNELRRLADQHPDHRAVIGADRSPREDARETARKSEHKLSDVLGRYDGPAGTGTLAALAGGVRGALSDPSNWLAMGVGPMGTVGATSRALAWNALKAGAMDAGVTAAMQPAIAAWRTEAGLDYGVSHFAINVGASAAISGGIDMGGRALFRGIQSRRGLVPRLDDEGGVAGWRTPAEAEAAQIDEALERAARQSLRAELREAQAGDPAALRRLADEAGIDDPEIRKAIDRHEVEMATRPRAPDLDVDEADAAFLQAVRHTLDEREPPPVDSVPLASRRTDAVDDDSKASARDMLMEGTGSPLEAAQALRTWPDLADGAVSLASHHMQVARALSRLSDEAFEAVEQGRAEASHAALVGQLVPDRTRHASVLEALTQAQPASLEQARHFIGDLMPPPGRKAWQVEGLDDPAGPQAKAQLDALERELGDRIDAALARGGDNPLDRALKEGLEQADRLETLRELMEACKP